MTDPIQGYEYVIGTANSYCDTPEQIEIQFHARLLSPERCNGFSDSYCTPGDHYQTHWVWKRDFYRPDNDEVVRFNVALPWFESGENTAWNRIFAYYSERFITAEMLRTLARETRENDLLPEYRLCGLLLNSDHPETATARELIAEDLLENGFKVTPNVTNGRFPTAGDYRHWLQEGTDTRWMNEQDDSLELAFWRNCLYAQHGYPFQDRWWREFFEKTDWYRALTPEEWAANPNPFSPEEQVLIDAIRTRERELTPVPPAP